MTVEVHPVRRVAKSTTKLDAMWIDYTPVMIFFTRCATPRVVCTIRLRIWTGDMAPTLAENIWATISKAILFVDMVTTFRTVA